MNPLETTTESRDRERLTRLLRKTLPEARTEVRALDLCPAIRLHLVAPDNMDRAFPPDEVRSILKNTPYWAFCWAAGHALAALLLENPALCRGRRVVDVGAGSGVAAVAAAMAGAREVTACDLDGDALEAVCANGRLNGVELEVCDSLEEVRGTADLLLASDLLYDRENRPLLEAFPRLASRVLVAESRVRIDETFGYRRVHGMEADTLPDLGESEAFRRVGFYSPRSGSWFSSSLGAGRA